MKINLEGGPEIGVPKVVSEDQVRFFVENGYLVVPDLMTSEEIEELAPEEEEEAPGVAGSHTLSPASAVLAGIVLAAFGFFCFGALKIHGPAAPALALALAAAMVLVSFGLMIVRRDVASQAIGFFTLENAISLAALVVASGLPLILETAFLFDLLVAVVVFGILIRAHHTKAESLSTADLTTLRG